MQLPMISYKLVAVSMLGMQLVTQTIAIPVNTQHSNAVEARGLLTGIVLGTIGSHLYHESKEKNRKEEAETETDQKGLKDEKGTAANKSEKAVVEK